MGIRRDGGNRDTVVLSEEELAGIAEEARRYGKRFGHPLDLEWAVGDTGRL